MLVRERKKGEEKPQKGSKDEEAGGWMWSKKRKEAPEKRNGSGSGGRSGREDHQERIWKSAFEGS